MSDQPDQIVDLSVRVPFGYKIKHVVARTGGEEPHADWSCTFVIKPAPEPRHPIDKAMDSALDLCLLTLNRLEKDFQQHAKEQDERIEKLEKHNGLQDARAQAVAGRSINHEARLEKLEVGQVCDPIIIGDMQKKLDTALADLALLARYCGFQVHDGKIDKPRDRDHEFERGPPKPYMGL